MVVPRSAYVGGTSRALLVQPHHAPCKCSALSVRERPQRWLNGKLCERPENCAYAGQCGLSAGSCRLPVRCLQGNDNGSTCPTVVRLFLIWSHLGKLHYSANHRGWFPTQQSNDGSCENSDCCVGIWCIPRASNFLHSQGQRYTLGPVTSCVVSPLHPAASLGGNFLSLWHEEPA